MKVTITSGIEKPLNYHLIQCVQLRSAGKNVVTWIFSPQLINSHHAKVLLHFLFYRTALWLLNVVYLHA